MYSHNKVSHLPCNLTHICSFPLTTKDSLSQLLSKSDYPNCALHPTLFCLLKILLLQLTPLSCIISFSSQLDNSHQDTDWSRRKP